MKGETATTDRAVGAHQLHLQNGSLRAAIACTECHVVPTTVAHANGRVDLTFGTLATTGGVTPAWNGTGCTASYCHGNFKNGNTAYAPTWTAPAANACGTCHGLPPGGTHPSSTSCEACHTGYTATTVNLANHMNGVVDVANLTCSSCHGDSTRAATALNPQLPAAPPVDTKGNTATTARGVGAHQLHLQDGAIRAAVACTECHVVPTSSTHATGTVDLTFGTLAKTGGVNPTWNGTGCAASYCHGNFKNGNTAYAPTWTAPAANACGTCHGLPPGGTHPPGTACGSCHTGYTATTVNLASHMNGVVDVANLTCSSCHGDSTRAATALNPQLPAAPPVDTKGNTLPSARGVGAHQLHLNAGALTAGISCGECHTVPGSLTHSNGTVDVTFGSLARTGGVTPAWNGTGCAASYCHGNFRNGNAAYVPTWTAPAGTACGTCHGLPPGGTHPTSTACGSCHPGYTISTVNAATHVNGVIDVSNLACTSCHGSAARTSVAGADVNQAAAPPVDSHGASSGVLVGTHVSHVNPAAAGQVYKPVACTECHPNNAGNASHANNVVNVTFAAATGANLGGLTPSFVQGNGTTTQTTCTTYCHGASLNATTTRGSVATWSWNGAAADCGSCHKSPPGTANHHNAAAITTCNRCHGTTVDAAGAVLVAGGLHVNGTVDTANLTCITCHGGSVNAVTGNRDPNVAAAPTGTGAPDTFGNTAIATSNGVGVHGSHVLGARSRPVLCNACHTVPTQNVHKTGVASSGNVVLGNLATTGSIATATYAGNGGTCSNTYCHGNLGGGIGATNVTPTWKTAGTLVCNACHGMPPAATSTGRTHPNRTDCGTCHTGYTGTTVNAATHVNGVVDYVAMTCTSCHGDGNRTGTDAAGIAFSGAPPVDSTGAATGSKVGAHLRHLLTNAAGGPAYSKQVACAECHTGAIPVNPLHANGQPNVAFGTLATQGTGTTFPAPSYTAGTVTCSNTYCHGNFRNGAAAAIAWTSTVTCTSCHGMPPGGSHPQGVTVTPTTCGNCHGNYDNTLAATNPSTAILNHDLHVDGVVDLSRMSCTSCHGDAARVGVATADANVKASPPVVASATGVAGVHLAHVNQGATAPPFSNAFACVNCHVVPTSNSHSDGIIAVTYSGIAVTGGITPPAYNTTAHTCSNTYCHGNFPGGNQSATAISWSTSGKLGCTACHGNPPPTATTHHPANATCASCHGTGYGNTAVVTATHVDGTVQKPANGCTACHGQLAGVGGAAVANTSPTSAPGYGGTGVDASGSALATSRGVGAHQKHLSPTLRSSGYSCTECHGPLPAPGDTTHANGTVAISAGTIAATRGSTITTSIAGSTLSCSATWCHGGNAALSGATASTIAWNAGATVTCTSCHGNPPTGNGHPNNPNCATCHGTGYSNTAVTGTALATHVDGTITLVAAESCTSCHGTTGRATGGIAGVTYDANQAAAPPNDTRGNAASVLVGVHLAHVNPAGTGAVFRPIACTDCHPNNTSFTHGTGAVNLTFPAGTAATLNGYTPTFVQGNGTTTATTCSTYCHGAKLPSGTAYATGNAWNGAAATCATCHGFPPATGHTGVAAQATACATCHGETVNADGTINVAGGKHINGVLDGGGEPPAGGSNCGGCHTGYFNAMTTATPPAGGSRHGIGSDVPTDSGVAWTGTPLSTSVVQANRSCVNMCHGDHPHDLTSPATTTHANNVFLDPTTSASRGANSASRIGLGGTGTQNRAKTDFDSTLNAGLCSGCHQTPIVANGITVGPANFGASAHDFNANTVGATTYTWTFPIHDGSTFARNCTKCHATRVEGTTPTATTTQSVHFNATDPNLLAGTTNPAGSAANFVCYNCHGSTASPAAGAQGDRSGKNIQAQIVHATTAGQSGHPSDSDTVHNSASEFASAAFGNALGVAAGASQRHAACLDCHDPHEAKAGTHAVTTNVAGPPLQGAWGAQLSTNPAFWSAPTATSFTKKTIVAGTDLEATLCFKCHSSYYWGTGVPVGSRSSTTVTGTATATAGSTTVTGSGWTASAYVGFVVRNDALGVWHTVTANTATTLTITPATTAAWSGAYTLQMPETDTAKEFNPANVGNWATAGTANQWSSGETAGGFHPVLAAAGGNLGAINMANLVTTNFAWRTTGTRNLMTCTDCHESDVTTDPNGPHGSAARFILKGPNTTWSSAVTNGSSIPAGTFCLNCHSSTFASSRFPAHSRGDHALACFNCHAAVPHGGPRPGMLVAPAGGATAVGGTIAGWDTTLPYSQPGAGTRLGLVAYPTNGTATWSQSNCGCGSSSPH